MEQKVQKNITLAIIGCGNMGAAMVKRWLDTCPTYQFVIVDRHVTPETLGFPERVDIHRSIDSHLSKADMIVIAMKPQALNDCIDDINAYIGSEAVILSVLAGVSLKHLSDAFGGARGIVRTMPNTPCALGQGVTIVQNNGNVEPHMVHHVNQLCGTLGLVEWVEDEALFDPMTAISGCGPAYVFYFIEALTKAGIATGLDKNSAARLARQTVIGGAALAEHNVGTPPKILRENVTSKGGVTAEALSVLMDGRLEALIQEAVHKATEKSRMFMV